MNVLDLPRNSQVTFTRNGVQRFGIVKGRLLNPNRKPGIGRVSYEVQLGRVEGGMFYPLPFHVIEVKAAELHVG